MENDVFTIVASATGGGSIIGALLKWFLGAFDKKLAAFDEKIHEMQGNLQQKDAKQDGQLQGLVERLSRMENMLAIVQEKMGASGALGERLAGLEKNVAVLTERSGTIGNELQGLRERYQIYSEYLFEMNSRKKKDE